VFDIRNGFIAAWSCQLVKLATAANPEVWQKSRTSHSVPFFREGQNILEPHTSHRAGIGIHCVGTIPGNPGYSIAGSVRAIGDSIPNKIELSNTVSFGRKRLDLPMLNFHFEEALLRMRILAEKEEAFGIWVQRISVIIGALGTAAWILGTAEIFAIASGAGPVVLSEGSRTKRRTASRSISQSVDSI
jgi:hypothetical protein